MKMTGLEIKTELVEQDACFEDAQEYESCIKWGRFTIRGKDEYGLILLKATNERTGRATPTLGWFSPDTMANHLKRFDTSRLEFDQKCLDIFDEGTCQNLFRRYCLKRGFVNQKGSPVYFKHTAETGGVYVTLIKIDDRHGVRVTTNHETREFTNFDEMENFLTNASVEQEREFNEILTRREYRCFSSTLPLGLKEE